MRSLSRAAAEFINEAVPLTKLRELALSFHWCSGGTEEEVLDAVSPFIQRPEKCQLTFCDEFE